MLSESAKQRIDRSMRTMIDEMSIEGCLQLFPGGPKEIVEGVIDACPTPDHPDNVSISENKIEAERIIGAMLGMM